MRAAMQSRVEQAVAEAEAKAAALRDAREKNVHFSARVVALNSRVAQLQKVLPRTGRRARGIGTGGRDCAVTGWPGVGLSRQRRVCLDAKTCVLLCR